MRCPTCQSTDNEIRDHIIYCNDCCKEIGHVPLPKIPYDDVQVYADLKAKITGNQYDWCEKAVALRASGAWEKLIDMAMELVNETNLKALNSLECDRLFAQVEIWRTRIEEHKLEQKIYAVLQRRKSLQAAI